MLTVFIKAFVPRRRQTACTKDLPVRGLCCAFYFVAPGSVLSGRGVDFCNCAGGWALVTGRTLQHLKESQRWAFRRLSGCA